MPDKRISQLPDAQLPLQDTDLLAIVQDTSTSPETRKVDIGSFKSGIGAGGGSIINVNYSQLYNLIQTGTLVPGAYYRFEYQTKHKIPYTNEINTGPVEILLVHAISASKVDYSVKSESHPEDIIYWRWDDNTVIDQVENIKLADNGGSPINVPPAMTDDTDIRPFLLEGSPVSRTGRIYYREDTIFRVSTPYDFRAVKFRRWRIQTSPVTVVSSVKAWADDTAYTQGDIISYSGSYYIAKTTFNSKTGASLGAFTFQLGTLIATLQVPYYVSPTPDTYTLIPPHLGYSGLVFEVDNSTYYDFTTFDNAIGEAGESSNPDISLTAKCYNCHIKSYIPAWLEQVTWEYYPNNVFFHFCNNIELEEFAENLTIHDSSNMKIGKYNKFGLIRGFSYNLSETVIEGNNEYLFIVGEVTGPDGHKLYQKIGSGNKGIVVHRGSNYEIGHGNYGTFLSFSFKIKIGNNNILPMILDAQHSFMGNSNTEICFMQGASYSECGDSNTKGTFPIYSNNNRVGDNNYDFSAYLDHPTPTIEGVLVSSANKNIIGNNTSGIRFVGNENKFADGCSSVTCAPYIKLNGCTFDVKNAAGVKFYSANPSGDVTIEGITFIIPKIVTAGEIEIDAHAASLEEGLIYNQSVGISNSIFARKVASYTDETTFTEELLKITLS